MYILNKNMTSSVKIETSVELNERDIEMLKYNSLVTPEAYAQQKLYHQLEQHACMQRILKDIFKKLKPKNQMTLINEGIVALKDIKGGKRIFEKIKQHIENIQYPERNKK